jgi:hypothetical protein
MVLTDLFLILVVLFILMVLFWSVRTYKSELKKAREFETTAPANDQLVWVNRYCVQQLVQSRINFWFSLSFAVVGFLIVISPIILPFFNSRIVLVPFFTTKIELRTSDALFAGIIVEFVAVCFFALSNRARLLMMDLFGKLQAAQKLDELKALSASVDDEKLKRKIQMLLALNCNEASLDENVLISILQMDEEPVQGMLKASAENTVSPDSPNGTTTPATPVAKPPNA